MTIQQAKCPTCGNYFETISKRGHKRQFCSEKCRALTSHRRRNLRYKNHEKWVGKLRACKDCGKEFHSLKWFLYCPDCRVKRAKKNKHACSFCGKELQRARSITDLKNVNRYRGFSLRFCSDLCATYSMIEMYKKRFEKSKEGENLVKEKRKPSEVSRLRIEFEIPIQGEIKNESS